MSTNQFRPTEVLRLRAVHALDLLDSPPEAVFDHIAQLAAAVCGTAGGGISLVDGKRAWFKSTFGVSEGHAEDPRIYSPCARVVFEGIIVELPDMRDDPTNRHSQLVAGTNGGRFYAGAPLINEQGYALGALFVIDPAARTAGLTRNQREQLRNLANHVVQLSTERVRRHRLLCHLATSGNRNVQAYREAPAILAMLDSTGDIVEVSDRWLKVFGYIRDDLKGIRTSTLLTEASCMRLEHSALHQVLHSTQCDNVPLQLQRYDGSLMELLWSASTVHDRAGHAVRYHVIINDVTSHQQLESALQREQERAVITLRSIGDGVISTDTNCRLQYLNPVAETMTGWSLAEALNQPLSNIFKIINEHTRETVENPVFRCLTEGRTVVLPPHTLLVDRHGKEYAVEDTASPIHDNQGNAQGAVLVFHDVSEQRRLQREVSHRSSHDPLTGLVNRAEFEAQLQRAIDELAPPPTEHAVCYLDLDQFKVVNDTSGHAAGDELLRQLAPLMRGKIRRNDVLARLGGDEFGVLLLNCGIKQATQIAENLRCLVEEFRFSWGGNIFKIGASIGLTPLSDSFCTVDTVLQAADQACYTAKDRGRNCVQVYLPKDEELARRHSEIHRVAHIPLAIEENRFQLYAQEISPLMGLPGQPMHFEILLRLIDGSGDIVMPGAFMPAAERYHRATLIDRWVVSSTLEWLATNPMVVDDLGLCAINLSGQSLGDSAFQDYIIDQIDSSGVATQKICFEITETAAMANLTNAASFMRALRDRGCRLALDDFGSGLSSFGYLKNLPVDILKIDGMFVRGIVDDPVDQALVRSINEIGQLLGKETIAECVENNAIRDVLRTLGVNYAQGFNAGRPEPLRDLTDRLMLVPSQPATTQTAY